MEKEQQDQLLEAVKLAYSQIPEDRRIRPLIEEALNPLLEGISSEDKLSLGMELWREFDKKFDETNHIDHDFFRLADFIKPYGPTLGP